MLSVDDHISKKYAFKVKCLHEMFVVPVPTELYLMCGCMNAIIYSVSEQRDTGVLHVRNHTCVIKD